MTIPLDLLCNLTKDCPLCLYNKYLCPPTHHYGSHKGHILLIARGQIIFTYCWKLDFSAGIDSPVSIASSTFNSIVLISLQVCRYLGTRCKRTISPSTGSLAMYLFSLYHFVKTLALGMSIFLSALTPFSALYSCI